MRKEIPLTTEPVASNSKAKVSKTILKINYYYHYLPFAIYKYFSS